MSNKFYTAAGMTLSVNGSNVANIKTWSIGDTKTTLTDVTNFGSQKLGTVIVKEQIPSMIEPGTFSGEAYYVPNDDGLSALRNAYSTTELSTFVLTFPPDTAGNVQTSTGDVISWTGYVTTDPVPSATSPSTPMTYKIDASMITILSITSGS